MSKKVNYSLQISRLHGASALVYLTLAGIAGLVMAGSVYPLTLGYLTSDKLASKTSAVLVPASQVVVDLDLRVVVIALLLFSVIVPGLYMNYLKQAYARGLKAKVVAFRWVDLAISSALMVETIAILSGVHDLMTLKLIGGLMILTCVFGWLGETSIKGGKKLTRPVFVTSLISGTLPWLLIGVYAISTPIYGMARTAWYVYALYLALFGCFSLLAFNQWRYYSRAKSWKDYMFVERNYVVIIFLAKVLFASLLIVGLKK